MILVPGLPVTERGKVDKRALTATVSGRSPHAADRPARAAPRAVPSPVRPPAGATP
ncbi:hypothetical protein ACFQYP_25010 [Nonomuraea antimicrobica]